MNDSILSNGDPHPRNGAGGSDTWDPDRDPLEALAAEFAERLRKNERPSIEEYVHRYPDLEAEIRDLFPTVAEMERLNRRRQVEVRRTVPERASRYQQLGDFRVIGEIGRGGMGIVYEAEQVTLGRRVAVKVLPRQALRSEKDIQRFQREARTAAQLHHSNIVPVFGVGEQDGVHYIVMQFIEGVGLDEILGELRRLAGVNGAAGSVPEHSDRSKYIKRNAAALLTEEFRRDSKSSLEANGLSSGSFTRPSSPSGLRLHGSETTTNGDPSRGSPDASNADDDASNASEPNLTAPVGMGAEYWRNVARIGMQAAAALQYAHGHGTLHRDVKPGNLLLDCEGGVWIADFGLAKAAEQDDVTWTGDVVGTLCYLAPERFEAVADARSDIYSLGLTMYEMLTLRRAYECRDRAALIHQISKHEVPPPSKFNPLVPRDLETIILKAIARDPADRYASAGMLAADLRNYLEDRPILARRMSSAERLFRWCRRNRAIASLTAAVAVLLVAVTAVATAGYARESSERRRAETNARQAELNAQHAERNARQAEATSELATEALDRIYSQFAPSPVLASSEPALDDGEESELLRVQTPLPLSDEVAVLLENLLDFYDRLSQHAANNQDVLAKSVFANRRVGDIHYRLGDYGKAQEAYHRAIERHAEMPADATDAPEMNLELARIHNGLGTVLREQHEWPGARAAHSRALKLLEVAASGPEVQYELARTNYLLHQADRFRPFRGRNDNGGERRYSNNSNNNGERRDRIQSATEILDGLVKQFPAVHEYRFLLAQCYLEQNRWPARKSPEHSHHCERTATEILEKLIEEQPEAPDYRYVLANSLVEQSFPELWRPPGPQRSTPSEALDDVEARLQKALKVAENLDTDHPNIPQYLRLKSMLHHSLARLHTLRDQRPDATRQMRIALRKQEQLVRRAIHSYGHKVRLAHMRAGLAELLLDQEQWAAAKDVLEVQTASLNELVASPLPSDAKPHHSVSKFLSDANQDLAKVREKLAQPSPSN